MDPEEFKERTDISQESIEETAENLNSAPTKCQQTVTECTADLATAADRYVRNNPWIAVGVVALYAFALGLLVGNRRD